MAAIRSPTTTPSISRILGLTCSLRWSQSSRQVGQNSLPQIGHLICLPPFLHEGSWHSMFDVSAQSEQKAQKLGHVWNSIGEPAARMHWMES